MLIKIDYRERDLIDHCKQLVVNSKISEKIQIVTENLHIGDVVITETNKDGEELLIIERKSLNDLAASIKDGRYSEQSFRLNQYPVHNHNIIYLIEGNLSTWKQYGYGGRIITKDTLYSSITSIMYYKGFSVMRTISMEETARWIVRSSLKLEKEKTKRKSFYMNSSVLEKSLDSNGHNDSNAHHDNTTDKMVLDMKVRNVIKSNNEHTELKYTNVMKAVKRNNITIDNIGSIMIMQIPGISSTTANTIMEHFENVGELIEKLKTDQNCLDNIYCTTKTGKKRKLNKSIRENLFYYLGNNNDYKQKSITIV